LTVPCAAAAAAAAVFVTCYFLQARDSLFDFSEDEDGESNFGWTGRKFKIHIKSKVCGIMLRVLY
jgi:hypothetical protein